MCNPESRYEPDFPPLYPQRDATREYEKARQRFEEEKLKKELEKMLQVTPTKIPFEISISLKHQTNHSKIEDLIPGVYRVLRIGPSSRQEFGVIIVSNEHSSTAYLNGERYPSLRHWYDTTYISDDGTFTGCYADEKDSDVVFELIGQNFKIIVNS